MSTYDAIPDSEIDIDKSVKSSTGKKFRDNPEAITQGDPTALAAGEGVAIDFDFGSGPQTAVITDETDQTKVLAPDGAGGVEWSSAFKPGLIFIERKEVASAVQNVIFSGLDGDTDEVYKIIGRIIKPFGVVTYRFRPNGVTTNQSIGVTSNGSFSTTTPLDFLVAAITDGNNISFECLIHARAAVQSQAMDRTFLGKAMESAGPSVIKVNRLAAGEGVAIDFDFGSGPQTAVITDETDQTKVLAPDGAGGVEWSSAFKPGLIFIERKEVASAVQNVIFSGLDGDTDEVYKIIGRIIKPFGVVTYRFRPNGVTTNQSIGVTSNGSFSTTTPLDFLVAAITDGNNISFECLIHARAAVQSQAMDRTFLGKAMESAGPSVIKVNDFGGAWTVAANMTSLQVSSTIATGIGAGSTFELFKLAQS